MNGKAHSLLIAGAVAVAGCRERKTDPPPATDSPVKTFVVRGSLRELPTDGRSAVIRHQAIPGYMPAMTMTFPVKRPEELRGLTPGDEVEFRLFATADDDWIEALHRVGHAEPGTNAPADRRAELHNGDLLPDEPFLSETGATRRLSEFRGASVALTFIFTRCPLPTFCPLMSRNFSRARRALTDGGGAGANWQFLSLSFDPEHDTPAALTEYAGYYRGENADHWLFGVLGTNALADWAPRLDLIVKREGDGFSHNLRTVVLDPEGRIRRQFDNNEWTPEELADAMRKAAAPAAAP